MLVPLCVRFVQGFFEGGLRCPPPVVVIVPGSVPEDVTRGELIVLAPFSSWGLRHLACGWPPASGTGSRRHPRACVACVLGVYWRAQMALPSPPL